MHKNAIVYMHPEVGEVWLAPGSSAYVNYTEQKLKSKAADHPMTKAFNKEMSESWKRSGMSKPVSLWP